MAKQAVLLLAHGTPETVEQIPEYLRNVVGGRPLPQHVIEEIQRRYALIGHSPLTEITLEQGRLAEIELSHPSGKNKDAARVGHAAGGERAIPPLPQKQIRGKDGAPGELAAIGESVPVYVAMRNWRPYIPDVIKKMRADGVEEASVLCLAPHNSRTSVGLYRRAVEAESAGLRIDFTEGWAQHPLLIEAFAERLRPAFARLSAEVGGPVPVLFTAHSVPTRTIQASEGQAADPYVEETKRTAALVAECVPDIPRWWFAFQSQGASGGEWIGPSVEETLEAIAASGARTLLLQPIGFLCDHVEILYDVDILFREFAAKLNLRLERPESLNASVTLARAVADLARQGLARLSSL